jgi:N-acetylneuraminate synthase
VRHIAAFGRPVILSTGMNDLSTIAPAVGALRSAGVQYALMHCTSMYPTPYEKVRLGALAQLRDAFPDAVLGLSDHSVSNYPSLGAVALGARVVERHFTVDKGWPGPDIPVSMDPAELRQLVEGSRAIHAALGGEKKILAEEQPTIDFAYASVVTIAPVRAGERLHAGNVWVKRPGTGPLRATDYDAVLDRPAARDLPRDHQLTWGDLT